LGEIIADRRSRIADRVSHIADCITKKYDRDYFTWGVHQGEQ